MVEDGPGWPARWPKMVRDNIPVGAKMATKMAQPRNKMGGPNLWVGGSRRFDDAFSEGFWLKIFCFIQESNVELGEGQEDA